MREAILNASLEDARPVVLRMVRLSFRRRLYIYARRHSIVDFESVLVTQRNRDFQQSNIDAAQLKATAAQVAASVEELLVVFDSISRLL